MLTLEQFDQYEGKLAAHDWYYDYSDDPSVWKLGNVHHKALVKEAAKHNVLSQVLEAWEEYVLCGARSTEALLERLDKTIILRNQLMEPLRNFG